MSRETVIAKLNSKNKAFNERTSFNSLPISPQENEDPLKKVLEKLESIEKRLSNIELKLDESTVEKKCQKDETRVQNDNGNLHKSVESQPAKNQDQIKPSVEPDHQVQLDNKEPSVKGFNWGSTLFKGGAPSFNVPVLGTTFALPTNAVSNFTLAKNEVVPPSQPTHNDTTFGMKDTRLFTPTSSSEGATNEIQANPFANSLMKFNLPIVGDWTKKEAKNEDEEAGVVPTEELPIENTCNMKPIELKTGEENEEVLFEHRCKLYRFRDKEYKERGLGNIKILKDRKDGKGRLIMRRDQIGLVCLNCRDCSKIERVRDTQVRWVAFDASDSDPVSTVFLVRFKTAQLTDTFLSHMQGLFSDSQDQSSISTPAEQQSGQESSTDTKPDIELVNPKLDPQLVEKARELQLPDLFYHKLPNQEPCIGCDGCEKDD